MSRIGNRALNIPTNVEVKVNGTKIEVKGIKGTLNREFSSLIAIEVKDNLITTVRANEEKKTKQLHGTTNAIILNMLVGVSEGYKKVIEIKGVGYKASLRGNELTINAGYSHPFKLKIPEGITVTTSKPTEIFVEGVDKEKTGQFAAEIRNIRRPNPYSGKGIMYKGEQIIRKEGKAAGK